MVRRKTLPLPSITIVFEKRKNLKKTHLHNIRITQQKCVMHSGEKGHVILWLPVAAVSLLRQRILQHSTMRNKGRSTCTRGGSRDRHCMWAQYEVYSKYM